MNYIYMSRVETHFGKIKILASGNKAVIDYIERNNLGDKIKKWKTCSWSDEIAFDNEDENYIILHKDANYKSGAEHILCKFIIHKEFKEGDYINIMQQTGPDEFEFFTQFYNGGTCLEEMLSDELAHSKRTDTIKQKIDELEKQMRDNAEDFKNGKIDYEDLHNCQYALIKELEKLKAQL